MDQFDAIHNKAPTPFDELNNTQEMNILKSVIPYMNYDMQKLLAFTIKIMEIKKTMNYYENNHEGIQPLHRSDNSDWKTDMLYSMKRFCSSENQCLIELVLNGLNMKKLYHTFQDLSFKTKTSDNSKMRNDDIPDHSTSSSKNENESSFNFTDMMMNMLSPEQKNMFETFKMLMSINDNGNGENSNG